MKRSLLAITMLCALLAALALPASPAMAGRTDEPPPIRPSVSPPGRESILQAYSRLPLRFEENRGQFDAAVHFAARHDSGTFFFTPQEVALVFSRAKPEPMEGAGRQWPGSVGAGGEPDGRQPDHPVPTEELAVKIRFLGTSATPRLAGLDPLPGTVNYFRGNDPPRWQQGVPTFAGIVYRDLYPGTDLRYSGAEGRLKYELVLQPGADPGRIGWEVAGAQGVHVNPASQVEIETAWGVLVEDAPLAWQEGPGGVRQPVAVGYEVIAGSAVRFRVGRYDPGQALVIDPGLEYSTFVGGSDYDRIQALVLDSANNAVVAGYTTSSDFPTTTGAYDRSYNGGNYDAFVLKLAADGGSLLCSTFVGGSGFDGGDALALDGAGNAVVTGTTWSSDFPTTAGAHDRSYNGGNGDVFVLKLAADGGSLLYSTFVGGSSNDRGNVLALDGAGSAVVAGGTWASSDFPTTAGAYDTSYNSGSDDAFVLKLAADGSTLEYSTLVGGGNSDRAYALALDGAGNALVAGSTGSSDFPTTAGAYDRSYNGGECDAFVLKLAADGGSLLYSTFVGGSNYYDGGDALALDSAGNAVVAGTTFSSDFPTTAGAYDRSHNGSGDVFVLKLAAGGGSLLYSTFVGGSDYEGDIALALDGAASAVVAGRTYSSDLPTVGAFDRSQNGQDDAFVLRLAADGGSLLYSTFLGGSSREWTDALALDGVGNAVVAGPTDSSDFPTTVEAYDTSHNGGSDSFVLKLHWPAQVWVPLVVVKCAGSWECEPNNTAAQANGPLGSGQAYYGTFPSPADEKDFFYIDLAVAHPVELWLTHIPAGQDYDLALWDASQNKVAESRRNGNADEHILTASLAPGRYYVGVYMFSSGSPESYRLRVVYK